MEKKRLKTGELARLTGKTERTIRYYEELGLLTPAERTQGGFRLFEPAQANRIQEITRLQEAGFSLDRIAQIVKIWKQSPRGVEAARDLREILELGIAEAAKRIQEMIELKKEIEESLKYLDECGRCDDQPSRGRCHCCTKGDHAGTLPTFFDKFIE
jgi:MerR family Zn(II)-responsive transcriptional regulator of zntA